jgi:hypothetical protein
VSHPPFGFPPCPDEIFGSWLSRIRLHNGDGWWRTALRNAGYGARSNENSFDIPRHSQELITLLHDIGMIDGQQALLNLTTLPYWLAFDAAPPETGHIRGTTLNVLFGTRKGIVRNIAAMARRYRARVGMRLCAQCLQDDIRAFGEPYWHRTHQLPNVTCCPDHRLHLLNRCPHCSKVFMDTGAGRISLPKMICECASDLRQISDVVAETDVRYRLAVLSRDALLMSTPLCSRSQLREFLRSRIRSSDLDYLIDSVYGQFALSRSLPQTVLNYEDCLWLPLSSHFSQLRAPDCCALLAAMDIKLSFAQRSAAIMETMPRERDDCGRPRIIPSVKNAREAMLGRSRNCPGERASADSLNYWVLRLHDAEWLHQHFPQTRFLPVPSPQFDRDWISRSATNGKTDDRTRTYRWRLIAQSVAGRRAAIRDCAWFEKKRREYFNIRADSLMQAHDQTVLRKRSTNISALAHHANALRVALNMTLREGARTKVTVARLAASACITLSMAKHTLQRDRALALEIRAARDMQSNTNNRDVRKQGQ